MFQRQAGTRADLHFIAFGDLHAQAGRDQTDLAGGKDQIRAPQIGAQIGTGRTRGLIFGQGQRRIGIRLALDQNRDIG